MNPDDVNVDEVLDDVANVLIERETGRRQSYRSEVRESGDVTYLLPSTWHSISNSLLSLDQSLAPLQAPAGAEEPEPQVTGPLKRFVKRMILKSVYWYVNPVIAQMHRMHAATARVVREIAVQLKGIDERLQVIEDQNLGGRLEEVERESLEDRVGRLERAMRENEAGRTSPQSVTPDTLEGAPPSRAREASGGRLSPRGLGASAFDFDYYWFESIHRGDRSIIKRRQQGYLEYFDGSENVLDIGCGRGEFLELMVEKGISGYGIDLERDAVQYCLDMDLKAEQAEANAHLASLPDESLGGIFISQVVEHMTPSELIELIGAAYRKIKPGCHLVIETPNPQCLLIFASFFYADISHVQPIHPETMRFLLLSAGFSDVEISLANPVPRNQRLSKIGIEAGAGETWVEELNLNIDKLNTVLFGYMDYAAVGKK
jgi:2-polyprenyl-3-methyl-5-hydroxy-6-metoxy-1,4-benzoquinol methylase